MNMLIVGGGKVGEYLAHLLTDAGHQVAVIERRPDLQRRLHDALPGVAIISGDGTDPLMLEAAGIRDANVVVAVTGADETNLVVASLARLEFTVPRTVARVNDPRNAWLYTADMGVDVVMNQTDIMAHLLANGIV